MTTYIYKDLPFYVKIDPDSPTPLFGVNTDGDPIFVVTHAVNDAYNGGVPVSFGNRVANGTPIGDTLVCSAADRLELATPFGDNANKNIAIIGNDGVFYFLNAVSTAPT